MHLPSFKERKTRFLCLASAVLLAGIGLLTAVFLTGDHAAADRAAWLQMASEGRTGYDLALILRPEENTLALTETVTYTNRTGDTLTSIILRTWANAYASEENSPAATEERWESCYGSAFSAGGIRVEGVWVNDALTETAYLDDAGTVLSIPAMLAPGETVTLRLHAAVTVPVCDYRFGRTGDTFLLTAFVPVIPVYEQGAWHTEAYDAIGDPFVQDAANFTFRLSVPEGWQVWSNAALARDGDLLCGSALAARDLSLIISREMTEKTGTVNGIRVTALGRDAKNAAQGLTLAKKALQTYISLYGDYLYPVFTLAICPLPFDSAEHPGISLINEQVFEDETQTEPIIALSCARQWFGAVTGANLYDQGWMSGAFARYAMLSYFGKTAGEAAKEDWIRLLIEPAMRERLNGTFTPGMPVDYFADLTTYISVVYDRGCALMCALDLFLKDGTDSFLRAYMEKYRLETVTRAEFEQFLNAYASQDLRPLLTDYLDTQIR